jgi:hypothetical protein
MTASGELIFCRFLDQFLCRTVHPKERKAFEIGSPIKKPNARCYVGFLT